MTDTVKQQRKVCEIGVEFYYFRLFAEMGIGEMVIGVMGVGETVPPRPAITAFFGCGGWGGE